MVQWRIGRNKPKTSTPSDNKNLLSGSFSPEECRDEDVPDGKQGKRARCNTCLGNTWFWEIVALIFSTLCFVAVVAVLGAYDRKARPNLPKALTLNTIVSILATGSKSSLLCMVASLIGQLKWIWFHRDNGRPLYDLQAFDDASRGPWGSLMMLFHRPNKERLLISLGAIITIASLTFDPFMQQIVSFPTRHTASDSSGARIKQVDVPWRLSSQGLRDSAMTIALNSGIWGSGFELDPVCPSGNCTWPRFQSAGWCSKCKDVTSEATFVGCDVGMFNISSHESQTVSCNIILPDGNWINRDILGAWEDNVFKQDSSPRFTLQIPWYGIGPVNNRLGPHFNKSILGVRNPLSAMAMVELDFPFTFTTPELRQALTLKNVTECVLSPCVKTYDVSVSGGVPSIKTSGTQFGEIFLDQEIPDREHYVPPKYIKSCWKPYGNQAVDLTLFEETLPLNFDLWETSTHFAACPVMWDLTGDGLAGDMGYKPYYYNKTINMWDARDQGSTGITILDALESSGFTVIMSNVAASMTKYAREHFSRELRGVVVEPQVYVVVNWYFIILPCLLIVSAAAFLILTVRLNRQHGLSLWKSSMLPIFYHGVSESVDRDELSSASAMEKSALKHTLTLEVFDSKRRLNLDA